jgi:hypothetical protein
MQWFKNHPGIWHIFEEDRGDDPCGKKLVKAKCGNLALVTQLEYVRNSEEPVCPRCNRLLEEPSE